jgi:colanic acid/amylovoran biosynthesis glycosyltransferase
VQGKVGYLIPEFPGQTHTWIWREIVWMRRWGVDVSLFSTRRPGERDRARHAFAADAEAQTQYLWPPDLGTLLRSVSWAVLRRPAGVARCLALGLTLPVEKRASVLALLPPSMILARALARGGITRLHAHSCSGSAILGMMVKRLTGIPFSLTLNADIEWWGGAMTEKFADADFTIAITQALLEQMKTDFPNLADQQRLLGRIGVDTDRWRPLEGAARSDRGGAPAARIVTVGRLHASKGHDVLISAVRHLIDAGRAVSLTIIGAGPEREALESQVRQQGLAGTVTFAGSLSEDEIIEALRASDVFALASHAEPLGVVYMEAMAVGLPAVGTDAGGVREIITDGVDGLLVPPRDARALAGAIARLLDDPALRARLGAAGRRTIQQRFDARAGAATLYQRMFGALPASVSASG